MLKATLLIVSVIVLSSCGKNGFVAALKEDPAAADPAGLVLGTYKAACEVRGPTTSSGSTKIIHADKIEVTDTEYEDNTCSLASVEYAYTYTYTDVGASTSISETRNVNLVEGKMYITPKSAQAATDFNGSVHCGFSNWAMGVTKDVSGDPTCQEIPIGTITYSIARTINDTLELGTPVDWLDPNEGASDLTRFTIFDDPQSKQ